MAKKLVFVGSYWGKESALRASKEQKNLTNFKIKKGKVSIWHELYGTWK
jgi:hypothetical protein